jgi:hypothetical protein
MYISISNAWNFALSFIVFILVALSTGVKRPNREGDNSTQSCDKVSNVLAYTYIYM